MNESIMQTLGFNKEIESVKEGKCPLCQNTIDPTKFKNELTFKEFNITGLCQKCQLEDN